MKRVFIDSDIILDLLAGRAPFYHAAAGLFSLIDAQLCAGYVSPLIFANLYYILRKQHNRESALRNLRKIRLLLEIVTINQKVIDRALNSDFKDFEDAIQYFAALQNKIDFLITRNVRDYPAGDIEIYTAEEFLEIFH